MNENRKYANNWRNNATQAQLAVLVATVMAAGCSYHGAKLAKSNSLLFEESRALTTAVVETLQRQPTPERNVFTETALSFAKQDQRVEGLPIKPFDVPALLTEMGVTNAIVAPLTENDEVRERFAWQEALIGERAEATEKLIDLGQRAEVARNQKMSRWTEITAWGAGLLGGSIALFAFCPLALPVAGRLLGWLVGKLPGLAGSLGVVSVKAFDAIVKGIENAKKTPTPASSVSLGNTRPASAANWIDQLQTALGREMDAAHKALVRSRKTALITNH